MKRKMLINISNHSSDKWSMKQHLMAEKYGEIVDFPFPEIDPYKDSEWESSWSYRALKLLWFIFPDSSYAMEVSS